MYGQHIEDLNIYTKRAAGLGRPVWTKSGNQGNKWIQAQVTISAATDLNVSPLLFVPCGNQNNTCVLSRTHVQISILQCFALQSSVFPANVFPVPSATDKKICKPP